MVKIFLFLFLLIIGKLNGQPLVPYFISSYSYNIYDGKSLEPPFKRETFYSLAYSLVNNKLKILDTLNANVNLEIRNTFNFPDHKIWYFEEYEHSLSTVPQCITILDYNEKFYKKRFMPVYDTTYSKHFRIYPIKKLNNFIIFNEIHSEKKFGLYYGRDKNFHKIQILAEDLNHLAAEGRPGFDRLKFDEFPFQFIDNQTDLQIPLFNKDGTHPTTIIQEPANLTSEDEILFVVINNDNYFIGYSDIPDLENDSVNLLKIYDKKLKLWSTILIPGVVINAMNYKNWLYGTTRTVENKIYYKDIDAIDLRLKTRYDLTYGKLPDLQYYPGILYLYNITAKKMIKWNTGDRDSEIITIKDDVLYYRVFDEIRTLKLDTKRNEIDWTSQKVLIKDKKRVPNIHWMFFAPKQDKIEEIWVNKPKEKKKK